MIASSAGPADYFYESQGLRLHYADWGNDAAPPLILIHGGRDHCRSWDEVARALQPNFHVLAPDLRGHGDSDWAHQTCQIVHVVGQTVAAAFRVIRWAG